MDEDGRRRGRSGKRIDAFDGLAVVDVRAWCAWAAEVGARIGLLPEQYERLSRQHFELQVRGALFRRQQWEDIALTVALHVMAAWNGGKKADGEYLTLADLLGREPVSLLPSPTLTDAEREEQEWEEMQRERKRARALVELAKVQFALAAKDGRGPEIVGG